MIFRLSFPRQEIHFSVHEYRHIIVGFFVLQVGVALSYALWAVSGNFLLFVLARIIGGLSKGNVSLSTAIVTDVTTTEKRSKGMVSQLCYLK